MGALEEDGRMNTGSRYKQPGDLNFSRRQGNTWRGAPNWSSPMPNGYNPFQHGPPHGSFQAIIPQFQSPPLFGVRPSMEVDHTGIPYHIPDADRFPSHLRPVRWQNVMDGSGPSHLHGWDGNNGVYREEMHMYGGGEWEQNRHPMNGRGWETSAEMWKGNGDGKVDLPSASLKEAAVVQTPVGDVISQRSKSESVSDGVQSKAIETKPAVTPSAENYSKSLHNTTNEKTPDTKMSGDNNVAHVFCAYLSKLDISTELVSPDLYSQCMSLLNVGKSATVDEDTSILVNLKVIESQIFISFYISLYPDLFYIYISISDYFYVTGWWKSSPQVFQYFVEFFAFSC
uniref:Uncharacterized protein MANES_06G159800 n=1 Tax=Rhizophora mucronata TaxID=61149 RepID=A0A2P2LM23_RHIMU